MAWSTAGPEGRAGSQARTLVVVALAGTRRTWAEGQAVMRTVASVAPGRWSQAVASGWAPGSWWKTPSSATGARPERRSGAGGQAFCMPRSRAASMAE